VHRIPLQCDHPGAFRIIRARAQPPPRVPIAESETTKVARRRQGRLLPLVETQGIKHEYGN